MSKRATHYISTMFAGAALIVLATTVQAEPRSYPLVCRAGSSFSVELGKRTDGARVIVRFRGATKGASQQPPKPGECAWLDRGWREGEPHIMIWHGDVQFSSLQFGHGGKLFGVSVPNGVHGQDDAFKYLLDALRSGNAFQVHAYRVDKHENGRPAFYLKITRVGP